MENAISKTAYYTLAVRAWDAAAPQPLCGDWYAPRLLDREAERAWSHFKAFRNPNGCNAARHRIIDDHLRDELRANPRARVVVIGAGFDTRAFRLEGGRWVEVDEPSIIALKDARLPATLARNPLERVAIEFAAESVVDRLEAFRDDERTHVIVEGVFMYLPHAERRRLLDALRELFPHHALYCDLMTRSFLESYSARFHEALAMMGATFNDMIDEPERFFFDAGYTAVACTSIPLRATEMGGMNAPSFVIRWLLKTAREGFQVWKFEHAPAPHARCRIGVGRSR